MLQNIPAPILAAYVQGLHKMLAEGDEAGVISAIQALDDLAHLRPELHAGYIRAVATIGAA